MKKRKHPLTALADREMRVAFFEGHVRSGIAHQVRLLRKRNGWSQRELAAKLGSKQQSTVARIEDPSYGRLSMTTVMKLAAAFDVAAQVRLVSFGKLLDDTFDLSPATITPLPYEEEISLERQQITHQASYSAAYQQSSKEWQLTPNTNHADVVQLIGTYKPAS